MIGKTLWSAIALLIAGSAASATDIRRVVTGLDANNKAIVLFDSRLSLSAGGSGNPATNLWITASSPPASRSRTTARQSGSAFRRRTTAP